MRQTSSFVYQVCGLSVLLALVALHSGCSWLKSLKQTESDASFPAWSQNMGGSARGSQGKKESQSSGLLFDERSKEIEKNLGGGY